MALKSKVTVHVSLICIELVVISLCASTCFIFVLKLFYIINHAILYEYMLISAQKHKWDIQIFEIVELE